MLRSTSATSATRLCCPRRVRRANPLAKPCRASAEEVTGLSFQPFESVKPELNSLQTLEKQDVSYARVGYTPDCEAAMNEQINVEYTISYVYHAMYAFFDRDNVALPGFASFFKAASEEEREHAEMLMEYQTKRGGCVKLLPLTMPEMEFSNGEKGEALYAMELALSLEKLNFQKLRELHDVAVEANDAALCDWIEGNLLADQVESVKEHAEYVSQLRRVGQGLGVYVFDKELSEKAEAA